MGKVAMAGERESAARREAAPTHGDFMACYWKSGTPSLFQHSFKLRLGSYFLGSRGAANKDAHVA